jgi:DNA-directed RNA polymerase III subunit RPC1
MLTVPLPDVPQTEEARTEALELMNVQLNLVTPKNGEPVIAATQDFITAAYLLSKKDRFYDRRQFTQICSYMVDAQVQIDIPPPTILKPMQLWTGKQIFGVLMRPNRTSGPRVNLEARCHTYHAPKAEHFIGFNPLPDLSPNDGWLVVVNSEVMCGAMDKSTVGAGKKKSIFGVLLRDYGPEEASAAMNRLAKLCARWLSRFATIPSLTLSYVPYSQCWDVLGYQRCHSRTQSADTKGGQGGSCISGLSRSHWKGKTRATRQ